MSSRTLIGALIVVAVVVVGLMSGHLQAALHAMNATHGLWVIFKGAAVVLAAAGLLIARVHKALRPVAATSRPPSAADNRRPPSDS